MGVRATKSLSAVDRELADFVSQFYADPLGFVQACYPWGEPGPLQHHTGPDAWQAEQLAGIGEEVRANGFNGHDPVPAIRRVTASGHGIGKSAEVGWLVDWIMSTRPHCQGTVTANTFTQLQTKTWASIRAWTKLCLTGHWFTVGDRRMYHPDFPETWFVALQSSQESNSEAFAGQHAATSTSFYVFDEASAIPPVIWEVAEGGLTDGEPMIFTFGNPTRNTGKFHEVCFGKGRDKWHAVSIDSRTSKLTNKALIEEWLAEYGEDSDFFRVRVRGLPPRASDLQFIDAGRVYEAQKRQVFPLADEPLIAGLDVSDGGSAWTVCRFRRGPDARSVPPIRIPGEKSRDRDLIISLLAERLRDAAPDRKIAALFIDSAFGAPIYERLKVLGFTNVHEVRFGGDSPDRHQANRRAYMWNRLKDWLLSGAIPTDERLEADLTGPGFHLNKRDQLVIESKESMQKRGLASPDDGDALALTFAQPVSITKPKTYQPVDLPAGASGWMGV
jgi:hypothetical protein